MRHNKKGRKLGTDWSHTKAMKRSLVTALFLNDRIKTVEARAKEIRPQVDKIITWAKRGDLHSRRLAIAYLNDKELVREIFEKVEQGMWQDRPGGYTRIMKLGPRKGDNAPMVIMELVTEPCVPKAERQAAAAKKAAAPKKATPKKATKKAAKSEELAEDLGFEADGTKEQIEAVDAAAEVEANGAELTDAEKVEAIEEKKAEEAEAFRETEETAGDPAEAAKEEAEKAESKAAKEAETTDAEKAEEEKADVKDEAK
ncbi:50S ribosomal protein L17 [uncultured Adlercreutzia sp.]|uniref:50S ribosomal protein L17 n=3 Tax=uncultured Adlercreutzia sp. TaxID=875803 RepID=UPI0025FA4CB4|nr:50S ribosomal protein L17 [uncultured Adlercreutzia sp.]